MPGGTFSLFPSSSRVCAQFMGNYYNVTKVYHYGPPDTATPAIAVGLPAAGGTHIRLVYDSDADLVITPGNLVVSELFTSGRSNWTVFELKGFQGSRTCLNSTAELHNYRASAIGLPSVGSVCKGCGCSGPD